MTKSLTDLWPHTMHPLAAKQFVAAAPFVATDPQVLAPAADSYSTHIRLI